MGRLRVCQFAFGDGADIGAVLVGALVGENLLDALVITLGQNGPDLGSSQLVIPGPRLVAAQACDSTEDRGAILVLALIGIDLRQVDLRERGELGGDLLGRQAVIARDRQIISSGDSALDLTFDLGHARYLAGLPSGALGRGHGLAHGGFGRRAGLLDRLARPGGGDVIGRLALDLGAGGS